MKHYFLPVVVMAFMLSSSFSAEAQYSMAESEADASLPVALSSFAAISEGGAVTLRWVTETEVGNVGFRVYRSERVDGEFTQIGWVQGHGSTPVAHDYTFIDKSAKVGQTYFYQIEDIDIEGNTQRSEIISITFIDPKGFQNPSGLPTHFALYQNFPNPFNPETWLPYDLAQDTPVHITIYNGQGHRIRTLNLGTQPAGTYIMKDRAAYWDGRSRIGELVSSGIYYYHLQAGDYHATKKMIILK